MKQTVADSFRLKLFLLGDCRVGKTSYVNRLFNNEFQDYVSTGGCDIQTKEHTLKNGNTIMVDIWDTAGQERFKSLTKTIVKNADGVLLIYDITDRKSLLNICNWLTDIKDIAVEEIKILIIGNKCEINHQCQVTIEKERKWS